MRAFLTLHARGASAVAGAIIIGIAAGLFGAYALIIPLAILCALLILNPVWGFYGIMFALPIERLYTVTDSSMVILKLASVLLLMGAMFNHRKLLARANLNIGTTWVWFLVYLVLSLPGIAQAMFLEHSLHYFKVNLWLLGLLVLVALSVKSYEHIRNGMLFFVISNALLSLYLLFVLESKKFELFARIGYSLAEPTRFAVCSLVAAVMTVYLLYHYKDIRTRFLLYVILLILAFMILITQSRSVWIATVILFVWFILKVVRGRALAIAAIGCLLALIVVVLLSVYDIGRVGDILGRRLLIGRSLQQIDIALRIEKLVAAKNIILAHPITGVGMDMFRYEAYEYGHQILPLEYPLNAHNTYLEIASDSGIPALIAFMMMYFVSLKTGFSAVRLKMKQSEMAICLNAIIVLLLVIFFFHEMSTFATVYVMFGIIAAFGKLHRSEGASEDKENKTREDFAGRQEPECASGLGAVT